MNGMPLDLIFTAARTSDYFIADGHDAHPGTKFILFVPRTRLQDTPLDIKGAGIVLQVYHHKNIHP